MVSNEGCTNTNSLTIDIWISARWRMISRTRFARSNSKKRRGLTNAEVVVSATWLSLVALLVCHCLRGTNQVQERRQLVVLPHPMPAGLDTLALVAANMSTAASTSSTRRAVALPASKFSHPDCRFIAFKPQPCKVSGCTRMIHSFCYAFAMGDLNPNSPLRCVDCIERPTNQQQIVPTTPNQQTITTNS